jgi:glutamate-ammonia-ligase adenylyltransferase
MGCASVSGFPAHRSTCTGETGRSSTIGGAGAAQCKGKYSQRAQRDRRPGSVLSVVAGAGRLQNKWIEHPRFPVREDARRRLVRLIERTGAWSDEGR